MLPSFHLFLFPDTRLPGNVCNFLSTSCDCFSIRNGCRATDKVKFKFFVQISLFFWSITQVAGNINKACVFRSKPSVALFGRHFVFEISNLRSAEDASAHEMPSVGVAFRSVVILNVDDDVEPSKVAQFYRLVVTDPRELEYEL